ncbi:MAG: hypothetical protein OFPII_18230 [Osedax symbiont Rs1]|nr:MAG: hypothetical protein OFPII_18230 [Osedax symbiont Rs1]
MYLSLKSADLTIIDELYMKFSSLNYFYKLVIPTTVSISLIVVFLSNFD